jgi:hypothetical protein
MGKIDVITYKYVIMVFNATFNNISVISWWSVILVEETGVPGDQYWPTALVQSSNLVIRGCHGCDRMVVGFTTTCAISAYYHYSCEFEPCSWRGENKPNRLIIYINISKRKFKQ